MVPCSRRLIVRAAPQSARRVEAVGNKPLHAELAHVAERHRQAGRLFVFHLVASFSHSTDSLA
jgi:hypothetical protein